MINLRILFFFFVVFSLITCTVVSGSVVLMGHNKTLSFDDIEANFARGVKASGINGILYISQPNDACATLDNKIEQVDGDIAPFVLIVRGGCGFEDKVRRAQKAGFKAAIIYDNEDGGVLVAMAGNSAGIKIHAVFVSKAAGEVLIKYAGLTDMELWIIPSFENSAWSIMAISFISLLAMSAVLATCFFVRRHRVRRERPRARVREFQGGMSSHLVKAMPSLIFTTVLEDNCTSGTCAICLEDYIAGEKLRILPCCHKFHAFCVDSWLTSWRTFCPVCKRDARTTTGNPPASERTPLLSSSSVSVASSSDLSSIRSTFASSSAIQIALRSPSVSSRIHSLSSAPYMHQSLRSSYHRSPSLSASRSSVDLGNAYSQRSLVSYLSPHSLGYPSLSPMNSRYRSPYFPSPSTSYVGSSSHHPNNMLHYSESANSFSPFTSAQSLPGC